MLKLLGRFRQLDDWACVCKTAMLACVSADEVAGVRTNWCSALQDLLSQVFWGGVVDSSTIDVASGRVK
jgi:hypothetical protein